MDNQEKETKYDSVFNHTSKNSCMCCFGGHTVQDDEPKYGLSVSGFVHPNKVWKNSSARVGDIFLFFQQLFL